MDSELTWQVALAALVAGVAAGAGASAWWHWRSAQARRQVPRKSSIVTRALVNSRERQVWAWLLKSFEQHQVMVKIPVTRFTIPMDDADKAQWFSLLSDVYCTFTLVTPQGKVVGCLDVPPPTGLSQSNLLVKRKLFARCALPYWIVEEGKLPSSKDISRAFVSDADEARLRPEAAPVGASTSELDKARADLQATVLRQRRNKGLGAGGSDRLDADTPFLDSVLEPDWAPDSFNAPLDSRQADLS